MSRSDLTPLAGGPIAPVLGAGDRTGRDGARRRPAGSACVTAGPELWPLKGVEVLGACSCRSDFSHHRHTRWVELYGE